MGPRTFPCFAPQGPSRDFCGVLPRQKILLETCCKNFGCDGAFIQRRKLLMALFDPLEAHPPVPFALFALCSLRSEWLHGMAAALECEPPVDPLDDGGPFSGDGGPPSGDGDSPVTRDDGASPNHVSITGGCRCSTVGAGPDGLLGWLVLFAIARALGQTVSRHGFLTWRSHADGKTPQGERMR